MIRRAFLLLLAAAVAASAAFGFAWLQHRNQAEFSAPRIVGGPAPLPAAEVGLVLGTGPYHYRSEDRVVHNPTFVRRLDAAAALWRSGKVRYLLLSGKREGGYDEPTVMHAGLVERGVRFVQIYSGGLAHQRSWDGPNDIEGNPRQFAGETDKPVAALLTDMAASGLLDETLVVMMGEMGRTPRINKDAGRDHWSQCQTVILAGGGIRRGAVVGASDETASYPTTQPYGIQDLLRTIFGLLGVDADRIYQTPVGRPVQIVNGGHRIEELLA